MPPSSLKQTDLYYVFPRKRTNETCSYMYIVRDLSKMGSHDCRGQNPHISSQLTGDPVFQFWVQRQQNSAQSQARSSVLLSLFYSSLIFNWLDEAHPRWGGQSAYLSPPIEMCISPRNTCTDTPRITLDQISRYPVTQSNWHTKVNHHVFLTKLPVVPHFSLFLAPQPE